MRALFFGRGICNLKNRKKITYAETKMLKFETPSNNTLDIHTLQNDYNNANEDIQPLIKMLHNSLSRQKY